MLITNFASGELSPSLNGRVDIQQYYQGANRIENFEITPTGGIHRRVGTQRVGQLGGNNRLIPFIVDKNTIYVLELGLNPDYNPQTPGSKHGIIRIWKNILNVGYEVVETLYTDYANLYEIHEVQYAQNYDTMIFVHQNYKPFEIKLSGSTFTASDMAFDFIPDVELDDDYDYVMIVADSNLPTKVEGENAFQYKRLINGVPTTHKETYPENITDFYCIVDGKLNKWNVNHWEDFGEDPKIDEGLFTTATKYPGCVAFFNNRLFFASTKHKPQMVWGSAAPDNYGTRYNDFCTYKKYVTVNRVVKDADLHIFTCDIAQSDIDTTNHRTTLTNVTQDFTQSEVLKEALTKYFVSSGLVPVGTKVVSATSTSLVIDTDKINVAYTEEHTVETNVVMSIQLWRTVDTASAEDYEYMVVANNITTADCALFFELASDQNDAIKFLSSNRFLAVGTESSIWSIDPGISALNINAVMQGRYGSDDIQGQAVETATVYFAQGKLGIREFYWDGESNAFRTNNIALLAEHIMREATVDDFDYMTNPYSRLIIVRSDGSVATLLYDKTNGIMAWNHLIMEHCQIKSCAVTRGNDASDLVFFTVKDGNNYYLEVLDMYNSIYLDSCQQWTPDVTAVTAQYNTGAVIYNADTDVIVDYENVPDDFYHEGDWCWIGYKVKSYIKSMPIVGRDPSKPVRIAKLQVRFHESYKPVVKVTGLPEEKFNTIRDADLPYSGVAYMNYPGQTDHDVCFEIETDGMKPVNILSVDAQTA